METQELNAETLLSGQELVNPDDSQTPRFFTLRKLLILGVVAILGFVAFLGGFMVKSYFDDVNQENAVVESGASVVDNWMSGYLDVGKNTVVVGGGDEDDSMKAYALMELQRELQEVKVGGATLDGVKVEIEPGKSFTMTDPETNEVIYDSQNA